jgi:hypothetical protein
MALAVPLSAYSDTFQDLVGPTSLNSYAAGKGGGNGGGYLTSFTVGASGNFYIGGYHFYNSGTGILSNQSYADNTVGKYSTSGWSVGPSFSSTAFGSNLGNYCTDTALQAASGSDTGLRALGNYNKSPFATSSTVPNPNMDGYIYLGSGDFGYSLLDSLDIVGDMMVGDPNAQTVYIQTDGGNESPPSIGFQATGATNWNISVSTSIAKPATPDQYYHPMAVAYGSDSVTYMYYVDAYGNIYVAVPGSSSVVKKYTESHAAGDAGLCTSGVTTDHHLYLAWVSGGDIYADVFTVGTGGALTAVATYQALVPTTGHLAGLSASSQGLFVDSYSGGSLNVGWITPSGSVLSTGTTPGQTIDTGLGSTGYVDGISAIGGTSPMVFATAARGSSNENTFYAISATNTSTALTVTSYTDTAHTDNTTFQGAMGACVNGSGYAVGKAYLTSGLHNGTAYLKVVFIQFQ